MPQLLQFHHRESAYAHGHSTHPAPPAWRTDNLYVHLLLN
jgi:hypothetical protein